MAKIVKTNKSNKHYLNNGTKHLLYCVLLFVLGGWKQIVLIGDSSPNINYNFKRITLVANY